MEMKASFSNNLPSQTKGVIINPENPVNPDSNNGLLRALSKTMTTLKNPRNPENPDSNNWLLRIPSKTMTNPKKSSKS